MTSMISPYTQQLTMPGGFGPPDVVDEHFSAPDGHGGSPV